VNRERNTFASQAGKVVTWNRATQNIAIRACANAAIGGGGAAHAV